MRTRFFVALLAAASLAALVACRAATEEGVAPVAAEDAAVPPAPDAGDAAVAISTFCSTLAEPPTFCADFDGERPFSGWINDEKTPDPGVFGGGSIVAFESLDPAHLKVARFTVPALLDANARAAAFLATQILGPPRTFDITFALRVERDLPAAGTGTTRLLMVSFGTPLGYIGLERSAKATELFVAERIDGSLKGHYEPLDHLGMAKGWTTFSLHVRNTPVDGGPGGEVTATLGSSTATIPLPASFRTFSSAIPVSIGVPNAQGPLDGFAIDFDTVQIVDRD
jgi:hypothetical protein